MKKYLFLLVLISTSAFSFYVPISDEEMAELKQGKEITRVEELEDEVFPRVTLINIIPHTPKENMETFSQFENHPKFIPGLLKAKIVKVEGNATDVAFEMEMPIVKNTKYTTRNVIEYKGNNALLTWSLVKSEQVKRTKGFLSFEEFEGKTLFSYQTHITPESSFAWAVKSRVVPDTKKNIAAVIKHLGSSTLLRKQ